MSQTQMTSPIAKDETIQQTNSLLTQIKNVLTAPIPDYISDAYDNTATYAVGDYCIHENTLYRCITAISSPEEWTAAHWIATTMAKEDSEIKQSLSHLVKSIDINETTNAYGTITVNIPASKPITSVQIYEPNGNYFGIALQGSASASSQWIKVKRTNELTNVASTAVTGKVFYLDI